MNKARKTFYVTIRGTLVPMIELQRVAKIYGSCKALTDVTLRIAPRQYVAVVGPAGSGKSTIVRLLLRAEDPTSGTVTVDGADVKLLPIALLQLYRQRVGAISEALPLIDNWTVEENVAYPLLVRGVEEETRKKRVTEVLKRLELHRKSATLADKLSAAERGMTMLARAVIAQPAVLIADEPTMYLDDGEAKLALAVLKEAHKRGTTVVLLTRDKNLVPDDATIIALSEGEATGRMKASPQEEAHKPLLDVQAPTPAEPPAKPVHTAKKKGDAKPGRKVRITSIGSDLG